MLPLISRLPINLGDQNTKVGVSLAAVDDVVDESLVHMAEHARVSASMMTLGFTDVLECLPLYD